VPGGRGQSKSSQTFLIAFTKKKEKRGHSISNVGGGGGGEGGGRGGGKGVGRELWRGGVERDSKEFERGREGGEGGGKEGRRQGEQGKGEEAGGRMETLWKK